MKKKKDDGLISKLLNIKNSRKLANLLSSKNPEIRELQKIKKQIKEIKTMEELEEIEQEQEKLNIVDRNYLEKLKRKKKKMLERDSQTFNERIRCNFEIINKIVTIGKEYKQKERQREDKELIQNRDERVKSGGEKQKEKEKERQGRTRSGGGRTRGER